MTGPHACPPDELQRLPLQHKAASERADSWRGTRKRSRPSPDLKRTHLPMIGQGEEALAQA